MNLLERLESPNPLIFDGGIGSELFARGVELANSTLANYEHPEIVVAIHRDYIEAGADIIETNSFVGSELHLEMAGSHDYNKIAKKSVELARRAIEESGREVYLAGSIGPSPGAIEEDAGDTDFGIANTIAIGAHRRLAENLAEGVDFFCLETMFSAKEAALTVNAIKQFNLPIAVNLTYKFTKDRKTGKIVYKTDWGHSAADLIGLLSSGEFSEGVNLLDHVQILGLNCGAEVNREEHTGMPYAIEGVIQLKTALGENPRNIKMMAYPNAGKAYLDRQTKRTFYTQKPEEMKEFIPQLLEIGTYVIGGCCGTGPNHIKKFKEKLNYNQ